MPKIDIITLLQSGGFPTPEALKESLGQKNYQLYENNLKKPAVDIAEALIQLGKHLEHNTHGLFGFGKLYKPLLCYAIAANLNNQNAFKAINLAAKKVLYRDNIHDQRIIDILTRCEERQRALKQQGKNPARIITINNELNNLLEKVTHLDNILLAERLDLSYEVYQKCNMLLSKDNPNPILNESERNHIHRARQSATEFMEVVLNVEGEKNILRQMNNRIAKRKLDPTFIPGKKPKGLTKLPNPHHARTKSQYHWRRLAELALARKNKKILVVGDKYKEKDSIEKTRLLTPTERDEYRVIIHQGKFCERQANNTFKPVDTADRVSHEKISYAAYTINPNGEISLFDHFDIDDGFAHSSTNAQGALFAAGEIKIINGELVALTVYSKHYQPALINIRETLRYFQDHGVDISNTIVRTWGENNQYRGNQFQDYNAKQFIEYCDSKATYESLNIQTDSFENFPVDFDRNLPRGPK